MHRWRYEAADTALRCRTTVGESKESRTGWGKGVASIVTDATNKLLIQFLNQLTAFTLDGGCQGSADRIRSGLVVIEK